MSASRFFLATATSALLLAACGGGGGSSTPQSFAPPTPAPTPTPPVTQTPAVPDFVANQFPESSTLKNLCETVRTAPDLDGNPRPDEQGELLHELFWLRSWMNETYLYYDQVTDQNPNGFDNVVTYFDELLTTQTTATNAPVDRFSFTQDTDDFEARSSGAPTFGFGASFARIRTNQLPRDWRVAFTQEGSPAETAGFTRGAQIISVDGADFLNGTSSAEIDTINAGLFPTAVGESTVFGIRRPDGTEEEITVESTSIAIEPVNEVQILDAGSRKVGYIHYHTFSPQTGEAQLFDAFTQLSDANVDDLVLDFRYNGGGLLFLAAQIGYMTAGPNSTNQTFYLQEFNAKSPGVNPVTGASVSPIPFVDETVGFSLTAGQALPSLDLPRVFVLTTARSCSASEAVMNGLLGIGVEVVQVGTRTCGKSTGQFPVENCGTTFAPLHFRGVNAQGFGDFDGGFAPTEMTGDAGPVIPGCTVDDDFSNPLGDANEAMLSAALTYAETGSCLATAATTVAVAQKTQAFAAQLDDPLSALPAVQAMDREIGALDLLDPRSE
ncbi:MAG: S41 family peptidase [Litorimonas sp.]